ncbi:MAG: phosphoribosylaminoimidazolesuccinocarboxamide synthase [Acidobacteriia bacterium]|nr:phosphoribosylaminoimidazolesuccinocarboxamide synthase [Terriglobia bacterium]
MKNSILLSTNLPGIELFIRGKVRDVYELGDELLIVATDRISAFDYVLGSGIPDKGRVLTQLSRFWFEHLRSIVNHHLISTEVGDFPDQVRPFRDQLAGRSMLVRRTEMIPVECVARGFLSGSGWKEYQASGSVCGIRLPAHLKESSKLPTPIFTPAVKAKSGHDENIAFDRFASIVGDRPRAEALRDLTLKLYATAAAYAESRGIIIADTKFEFGLLRGKILLIDECLTSDSSRFWPKEGYREGGPQASFDKQYVRDYLESIRWNKQPPAPALPEEVTLATRAKYLEAFQLLTGGDLAKSATP